MNRSLFFTLVALAGLLVGPSTLAAQEGAAVRIAPRAGLLSPDGYFYEYFANFSGDGPLEWTNGSLGRAFLAGVSVEVGRRDGGVLVRGEILRSFDGWLSAAHSIVRYRDLYIPSYIETSWLDVPTAVTVTSLQLVVPTRVRVWALQPYVVAGVGGKLYQFGDPEPANDVNATLPTNGFTWGADVGAGFMVPFLGLDLDVQARDAINRYWGKTEHDILLSGAVFVRVR